MRRKSTWDGLTSRACGRAASMEGCQTRYYVHGRITTSRSGSRQHACAACVVCLDRRACSGRPVGSRNKNKLAVAGISRWMGGCTRGGYDWLDSRGDAGLRATWVASK